MKTTSKLVNFLGVAAVVVVLVAGCSAGVPAATKTSAASTAVVGVAAAAEIPVGVAAALQFPESGAGAVGIAAPDGSVRLLGQGGDTGTRPIASITKVITALVVLSEHPLAGVGADGTADHGPTITLGQADLDITEEVEKQDQFVEPVYDGQQVTLHDALAITLLTSANNCAESVARWAFGSEDAYLAAARAWLAANGLTQTTLADASGLDPGSASSTADLLHVAALAHANPALLAIAGMATYDQPGLGTISNQNMLLGENGVDGLKTGLTSYAGFTLLTSAVVTVGSERLTLVAVVLATPSLDARFASTRALLASARAGLAEVPLAVAGQLFGTYTLPDGRVVDAVAVAPLSAIVFGDEAVTTTVALDDLPSDLVAAGPGEDASVAGASVGTVSFAVGGATLTAPLAVDALIG
ncbi:hypothetical protein B7R21_07765 [Subtercola boreus]|uniref:Peptidase S11 D-alanyl-D-alanine carboxypeptidase A N-terminal domain-containing protein n=1 Tax=Subtercola boreus TaxID=120213 RepID=A0A3E0VUK3_9MICO|nr:D-alanyl-D-alanine carboxypeptidase [Subtercola boreus]RFA13722.1 hypothetical protein B7R21_07765 [Subtercola boreus]